MSFMNELGVTEFIGFIWPPERQLSKLVIFFYYMHIIGFMKPTTQYLESINK